MTDRPYDKVLTLRDDTMLDDGPFFWIQGDNGSWDGPVKDWAMSHSLKYFNHVKKKRVVVTAGANQGLYVKKYARMFEHVYAFEPDPLNFYVMSLNNQFDNVVKMNCALGSENCMVRVNRNDMSNTGMHTVTENQGFTPCLALDSLQLPDCDLLQLDVEGFEYNILLGAINTIDKYKPVIVLENGHTTLIENFMIEHDYVKSDQSVADVIWIPKR